MCDMLGARIGPLLLADALRAFFGVEDRRDNARDDLVVDVYDKPFAM